MKRLNPLTGKPFKRGETREDGFIFVRYLTNRPIKENGLFREEWKNPERQKYGKKRINPDTQKPFRIGDFNSDKSKQFWQYVQNSCDKNGFCYEDWLSPLKFRKAIESQRKHSKQHKEKVKKRVASGELKRRLNPKTGEQFKEGDRDNEGKIFANYVGQEISNGYVGEYWVSEDQFLRRKLSQTLKRSKNRAEKNNLAFDLTLNYLHEIFPKDFLCPVFKTKMQWGGDKSTSPSLDRILPDIGYIKGNVAFISDNANTLKLHRSPDVLRKIADFVETHSVIK